MLLQNDSYSIPQIKHLIALFIVSDFEVQEEIEMHADIKNISEW